MCSNPKCSIWKALTGGTVAWPQSVPETPTSPTLNPNCICGKPLLMVIPPGGICCPVHPTVRFYGTTVTL